MENPGHVTSNANNGHIIIRPDAQTSWSREVEHQQLLAQTAMTDANMPAFDKEEGLFDIESDYDRERRLKPMSLSAFRYLCEAFQIRGVKIKFRVLHDEIVIAMAGYRNKREIHCSPDSLPFEAQALDMLTSTANACRHAE